MNTSNQKSFTPFLVFGIAFVIPLAFAMYTNHAWEDWYITYRASKNLALGHGLVFTVGQRIHSFTSPFGTLIPAFLAFITANRSDDLVLWLFRIFNCALLGGTAVILYNSLKTLKLRAWSIGITLGLFCLDAKILDFSINGMETAINLFFLNLGIYALLNLSSYRRGLLFGLASAGLMWSRPDGFIYIFALVIGFLVFNDAFFSPKTNRQELIKVYLIAAGVCTVLYLPWILWAWSYYGSFVPHTVIAKGLDNPRPDNLLPHILAFPLRGVVRYFGSSFYQALLPPYALMGGWPTLFERVSTFVAWVCAFAWLLPFVRSQTRALSLATFFGHVYLSFGMIFAYPWYFPNVIFLSTFVLGLLIEQMAGIWSLKMKKATTIEGDRSKILDVFPQAISVILLMLTLTWTLGTAYQMRVQQMVVEEGNRKQIGLWLRDNAASPSDRVFLECLGYIGFYSNLKMYDFPGLSSPEVVAARQTLDSSKFSDLIDYLRPDWLVLRPGEVDGINQDNSTLLASTYLPEKVFDVTDEIASYSFLPGRNYVEFDRKFTVFKLQDES